MIIQTNPLNASREHSRTTIWYETITTSHSHVHVVHHPRVMFRDWMTRTTGCKTKKEKHVQRLNLVCLYRTSVILHTEFCVLCSLNLEHPMLLGSHSLACPMQICCSQKQPTSHSFRRKQASKPSPHWYPCNHLGVHVYYGKRLFSCYTPGSLLDQKNTYDQHIHRSYTSARRVESMDSTTQMSQFFHTLWLQKSCFAPVAATCNIKRDVEPKLEKTYL